MRKKIQKKRRIGISESSLLFFKFQEEFPPKEKAQEEEQRSLLFSMEYRGDKGALDLHCALGAELLATEASDAKGSVYTCLFVFYNDSLGRANISANTAAYAHILYQGRLGFKHCACDRSEEPLYWIFAIAAELQGTALDHSFKIPDHQGFKVAEQGHLAHASRNCAAAFCGI